MVVKLKEKIGNTRNVTKKDKLKKIFFEENEIRDIMIENYLNQKKINKNFIGIYHVSGFFEFLILIVSVIVFKNIIFELPFSKRVVWYIILFFSLNFH